MRAFGRNSCQYAQPSRCFQLKTNPLQLLWQLMPYYHLSAWVSGILSGRKKTTSVFDFKCREDTKCCCRCLATVKQHRTIHPALLRVLLHSTRRIESQVTVAVDKGIYHHGWSARPLNKVCHCHIVGYNYLRRMKCTWKASHCLWGSKTIAE